ncbi:glycosyl transferase [Halovulum dunhuangense]|uniref:Peptide O-xylosyltransferase n=1 Tax=Halovulum dunhuangense TaxID=1505036 RepID=A0A849KV98_9RHOB|nr:beta-1,6-N-acetylglucosaminyltransferase [Halovulum dunhuangense]NNU78975.1 glycosyl transferase [Halovulum dunhuangense]
MIGVVILAHDQLRRTAQLARFMADNGCKVVVHIDSRLKEPGVERMMKIMGDSPDIALTPRRRCEWGTFSLVDACIASLELMFRRWPGVTHVCQLSGSCLPIKPIAALRAHLAAHPDTDFIESVDVLRDRWVVDGLAEERFSLYHPLPWRRFRRLFDWSVKLQRRLGVKRRMPEGLSPRIGSQWWCLSRATLDAILADPRLPAYRRYFRTCWIPDESFFQTLAAKHGRRICNAPLTLVRFDPQGKPFVFYDDHLDMLLRADGFFARKIWRGADTLYDVFLGGDVAEHLAAAARKPGERPHAVLRRATERYRMARPGLVNHGCHPGQKLEERLQTARPYLVIDGLQKLFPNLPAEVNQLPGAIAHGELYHPERVEFAGGAPIFTGNLSASVPIRDHKPVHFLSRLIWTERGSDQLFVHDFRQQRVIDDFLLRDPNAHVLRLSEAWLLDLCRLWQADPAAGEPALTERAAQEAGVVARMTGPDTRAQVIRLGLDEVLRDGVAAMERAARKLPDGLSRLAVFSGPILPVGFAEFLDSLPRNIVDTRVLAHEVRRYDAMTRVLRRKA